MKFGISLADDLNDVQEELGDMELFAFYLTKDDEQIDLFNFNVLGLFKSYYLYKTIKVKKK